MIDQNLTAWFIQSLTGDANTVIDWRCIHDQRKDLPAHNYRGTIAEQWATLVDYNSKGYGIFCTINASDGQGQEISNIKHLRAHVIDLDNTVTAQASYDRATANGASFAVQTSDGKYHVYWRMQPYEGHEFFSLTQRKLNQLYGADKSIIDVTRVMRVPGFMHQKGEPLLVRAWPLPNFEKVHTSDDMTLLTSAVNVIEHISTRSPLGDKELAAPSLGWLEFALQQTNPNEMERAEWLSFSAAFKQAGWSHSDDNTLFQMWSTWCNQYGDNDGGENLKLWNSIVDTEVGWKSILYRCPTVKAHIMFGHKEAPTAPQPMAQQPIQQTVAQVEDDVDPFGEILSEYDCEQYFKDCFFVEREGKIFGSGRFMNANMFNGRFGGKRFIIDSTGKITDEPWKAALRSTVYTIEKVDHVRFLPQHPQYEIVRDGLGRKGLNTYIPANIDSKEGDLTIWFDWFDRIFPDKGDQKILFDYMAHCIKYPGHKIPWSPLIQSTEGIGKTMFKEIMANALGDMYVYSPKAPELVSSGSTFNAWMRGKLMILVDEIKIDERRELVEILKPMITDNRIEIQSKGVDQEMEDNPANWIFFSNFKDAIPINKNGRRYAILYSILQSKADLINAGMDDAYFRRLWDWMHNEGGVQAITHWLLNYPIECGDIPVRAPVTSSQAEAISISRSPMEVVIANCIEDGVCGFRGGYISSYAVINRSKAAGIRQPTARTVQICLEGMGFVHLGRSPRAYMQEDVANRSEVFATLSNLPLEQYGKVQGYD